MDYIIWGLIAVQVALIAYQGYVYNKIDKVDSKTVKGVAFFRGYGVVILSFAICGIVILLNYLK